MKSARWDNDITDFSVSCMIDSAVVHSSCVLRVLRKEDIEAFLERLKAVSKLAWYP